MKVAFSYFLLKVPAIFTEGWTKKLIKKKTCSCKNFLRLIENRWFTHFVSIRDFLFTLWAGRKFCQA